MVLKLQVTPQKISPYTALEFQTCWGFFSIPTKYLKKYIINQLYIPQDIQAFHLKAFPLLEVMTYCKDPQKEPQQ